MTEDKQAAGAPWHLWAVGALSLLFTTYGAYDYYMSQIGDRDYIAAAVGPMGLDVDAAVTYFAGFPWWMDAVWAIGVWSGVAGSVLLLARRKLAWPIFLLSLGGLVVSNAYGFVRPMPGMTNPTPSYIAIAVVFTIMLLIALYARAMARRGVLA